MQKKLAIISNTSWYIFNFRANLIKNLIKNGYTIITIAPFDSYTSKLERIGCKTIPISIDSKSKNPIMDIILTIKFIGIFQKEKPDLLLNFTAKPNIYGTVAGNFYKIPSINNIAGLGSGFVNESLTTKLLRILYKFSQRKASKIFFQNNDDYNDFLINKIVNKNKCSILPGSGVDLSYMKMKPLPILKSNRFIFLFISRMLYSKGAEILFKAAKRIYEKGNIDFTIQLLGATGINNSDAIPISVINEWDEQPFFEYLGKTDDVRSFIEKAHCIILPSYYREGTPKSILEGLAIGRPVITTNMPGCKTAVIEGENGYIVPPKDEYILAEKMEMLMTKDFEQLQNMGIKSRKLAEEKFDECIVINMYLEEIKNLL